MPERALVDASQDDPLGVSVLLSALARRGPGPVRIVVLSDIGRKEELSQERLEGALRTLRDLGVVSSEGDGIVLRVENEEALSHAAVLRGVAYARHCQRDTNTVEIALSPPARPSRLMEVLPKMGYAWARLHDTRDSLIELAASATQNLTIVSPFLDQEGLAWICSLFEATRPAVRRTLIVRGRDELELSLLRQNRDEFVRASARVLSYAISHDPHLRSPEMETFHAKIFLGDSDRAYVGSANMTRWSRNYSMECGVLIAGPCVRPLSRLLEAMVTISARLL